MPLLSPFPGLTLLSPLPRSWEEGSFRQRRLAVLWRPSNSILAEGAGGLPHCSKSPLGPVG